MPIIPNETNEPDSLLRRFYIEKGQVVPTDNTFTPYSVVREYRQDLIKQGLLKPRGPREVQIKSPNRKIQTVS